jgi:Helix-turn-helix domain of resolvase
LPARACPIGDRLKNVVGVQLRHRALAGRLNNEGKYTDERRWLHPIRVGTCVLLVRVFSRSPALRMNDTAHLRLAWLAGLLEAEGTFLQPIPSEPRFPIVACQMTDLDVVERVGSLFGTTVTRIPREGRRNVYATRLKGSRAVLLMRDLAPLMSERRAQAITASLDAHAAPRHKLDFATAERIRHLYAQGISVSHLAKTFGVARATVRQILERSIYGAPAVMPWRCPHGDGVLVFEVHGQMSLPELYWLAGWLEGEGSFLVPPPSDPRRPRIVARTRDADVAEEVGRLLAVRPLFSHDGRERERGWSPSWRLLRRGRAAARLMKALHPLMGARRRSQIESALAAANRAARNPSEPPSIRIEGDLIKLGKEPVYQEVTQRFACDPGRRAAPEPYKR